MENTAKEVLKRLGLESLGVEAESALKAPERADGERGKDQLIEVLAKENVRLRGIIDALHVRTIDSEESSNPIKSERNSRILNLEEWVDDAWSCLYSLANDPLLIRNQLSLMTGFDEEGERCLEKLKKAEALTKIRP